MRQYGYLYVAIWWPGVVGKVGPNSWVALNADQNAAASRTGLMTSFRFDHGAEVFGKNDNPAPID